MQLFNTWILSKVLSVEVFLTEIEMQERAYLLGKIGDGDGELKDIPEDKATAKVDIWQEFDLLDPQT